jgi:Raf kinase inhibitor-like YbhB/YbcL family protein
MLESGTGGVHLLRGLAAAALAVVLAATCSSEVADVMHGELTSTAFAEGGTIPSRHTCDGEDISPPLQWNAPPDGTAELALVVDDPDAGGFVHWVVVGLRPTATGLDEGLLPAGARVGRNDFGGVGYRGPCPPSGEHRYVFTLYALSQPLAVLESPTAAEVRAAARGVTIFEAPLTGTYTRR